MAIFGGMNIAASGLTAQRLRTDVTIKTASVVWNQPYARKQYYTNKNKSYWAKRMWQSKGTRIIKEVANYCGGR